MITFNHGSIDIKHFLFPAFLLLFPGSSFGQTILKMPVYKNSISMDFIYVASYVVDLSSSKSYFQFPAFALTGEFRIKNKFYGELGIMPFGADRSAISHWNYKNYNSTQLNYAAYAGGLMKFRVVNNFYFTPSIDLFFFQSKYRGTTSASSQNDIYFGLGGAIGFEYFLSKRISLNADVLSMSYGLRYDTYSHPGLNYNNFSYLQKHGYFGVHKMLSVGIHYNFNWKK